MSSTHAAMTTPSDFGGGGSKYVPPHKRGHGEGEGDSAPSGLSSAAVPFVPRSAPRRDFADLATPDAWTSIRGRGGGARGARRGGGYGADPYSSQGRGKLTTTTGTGWDIRDGRSYRPDPEHEIFQSGKEKSTGINFDSYENIPVEMTGNNTSSLVPIESFLTATDQIHPLLLQNILKVKYERPTPVQKYSIPGILAGRDLMSCAQTGSGKTAAFLFPIITKMLISGPPPSCLPAGSRGYSKPAYPVGLVLSPTRELAVQIFEEAKKFAYGTGIRPTVVYGGADMRSQLSELERGCDICVATPGRLTDTIERRKVYLQCCKYLVLDEADRMLDMGFSPQIRDIVQKFDMPDTNAGRQTVMFSATFPREIQQLARDFMQDYVFLTVGRVGSTNSFITQNLIYADESDKPTRLLSLLKESTGLVLIFVETKRKADMIEDFLLSHKMPAVSIHGDRTQQERESALRQFRSGRSPVLVATDVAARGLDIHNITHVINCDLPTHIDDYVHRIGRTGRAGNVGQATSFVNSQSRPLLRDLLGILEESGQDVPGWFMDMVKTCTAAASRFGNSRYGGGGGGRGGRGGRSSNFGARDIRDAGDMDRRVPSARAGASSAWRSAPPPASTGTRTSHAVPRTNYPAPVDENDAW